MDFETKLAILRTSLAEKRTALAELQLGILLVTLPITIHTGLVLLASRHEFAARLHVLVPLWVFLGVLLVFGAGISWRALRQLRRLERLIIHLRQDVEASTDSPSSCRE
jgi:uncharacterized membrane protein YidH (DUF202 family)